MLVIIIPYGGGIMRTNLRFERKKNIVGSFVIERDDRKRGGGGGEDR